MSYECECEGAKAAYLTVHLSTADNCKVVSESASTVEVINI